MLFDGANIVVAAGAENMSQAPYSVRIVNVQLTTNTTNKRAKK